MSRLRERLPSWATTLSAKYMALFALLVAVPVIGVSVYLLDSSYTDTRSALIAQQQERAGAVAASITST